MKPLITVVMLVLLAAPALAAEPMLFRNQSGSEMGITIDGEGRIEGFYRSALGCGKGIPRPLAGWLNQSALTFTVNFQECKSVTAWVGHMKMDGSISALWTMARGEGKGWTSKLTGASEFTPVAQGRAGSE